MARIILSEQLDGEDIQVWKLQFNPTQGAVISRF